MDKNFLVEIANALMKKRLEMKLDVNEAAGAIGISQGTLRSLEVAGVHPQRAVLKKICAWLGIPVPETGGKKAASKPKKYQRNPTSVLSKKQMSELVYAIKTKRRELALTIKYAAQRIGVSRETLYCLETGKRVPRPQVIEKIAEWLGIPSPLENGEIVSKSKGGKVAIEVKGRDKAPALMPEGSAGLMARLSGLEKDIGLVKQFLFGKA